MAPPIPGRRQPVRIQRRSFGDVLAGMVAIAALIALTVGVPIGLITVLGLPIPHAKPTLSLLTHQLDILSILKILSVIVWLAWLQLVFCVLVEIKAAVSNVGVPARVPLSGGTQSVAHRLVTAALLLFTATAALSPAMSHHGPPRPQHTISAGARPGTSAQGQQPIYSTQLPQQIAQPTVAQGPNVDKVYVVKPPVGRFHESLWEVAQNHLGDGRRYNEIFELNKDKIQPDGSKLTIASLIRPGWILHMPRDAYGPGIEIVTPKTTSVTPGQAGSAGTMSQGGQHAGHGHQAGAGAQAGVAGVGLGAPAGGGGGGTGGGPGAPVRPNPGTPLAAPGQQGTGGPVFPYELSAASLLAAGVLAALGRRRREQLWRRAFGRRVVRPEGEAAAAEAALRLGAHEPSVRLLDTGLRSLSQALAAQGKTPPTVFAAHLGQANLDLWIAPSDSSPPPPWTAVDNGQVWRLPLAAVARLDPDQAGAALAPYPGLVSIGTNETGRILVDLEVAHGLIAVRGPHRIVQAALAALAAELATNRWSDRMRITLVGFGRELTMLAPDRVTAAETLEEALPALEARAAEVEHALASSGAESVLTGRSQGSQPDAWAPHYLIMAVPPTPQQRERLLALARTRHRMAAGYVVAGDVQGATWTWDVTEQGRLKAGVLGFDLHAQLLPPQQYAALVELFRVATQPSGVVMAAPVTDAAPAAQLIPGSKMPVEISLLGQVAVHAPGVIEPDRVALATELVVYLAAHPDGVHPNVLTGAIWPRGVTTEVRNATLSRVQEWLGADDLGRPSLATDASGRMRLGAQVRVDWQVFRALAAHAAHAREAGQDEAAYLARALDLVRGQLLDGRDAGRYAWLATDDLEYEVTARVADSAHRLSELRLAAGDAQGAMDAARAGLRLAFNDELLWRDLLRGAAATGQQHVLRAVVGELSARVALDEVLPRMAPETESLIDELLPSWRSSVA